MATGRVATHPACSKVLLPGRVGYSPLLQTASSFHHLHTIQSPSFQSLRLFRGKEGKNETVVFVPTTTGSELKKRYQKTIEKAKVKVAVGSPRNQCEEEGAEVRPV